MENNVSVGRKEQIEILAELEHEQWVEWSKNISERENLSQDRVDRWMSLWIPYSELSEEMKEQDRVWARKSLDALGM